MTWVVRHGLCAFIIRLVGTVWLGVYLFIHALRVSYYVHCCPFIIRLYANNIMIASKLTLADNYNYLGTAPTVIRYIHCTYTYMIYI